MLSRAVPGMVENDQVPVEQEESKQKRGESVPDLEHDQACSPESLWVHEELRFYIEV